MEEDRVLTGRVCLGLEEPRWGTHRGQLRLGEWGLGSTWGNCWRFLSVRVQAVWQYPSCLRVRVM